MRRRLYFVLPDVRFARKVHNELLLARIPEHHMHMVAREGVPLDDLPQANLLQTSDLVHGAQMGLVIGGVTGLVLSLLGVAIGFLPAGYEGLAVLVITLTGAVVGTWASSMVALAIPNTRLQPFQDAIDRGHVLLMVEVPVSRVDEVTRAIRRHHPRADAHGVEPTIPAFP